MVLKDGKDRSRGVALLKLRCERMGEKATLCFLFVSFQSGVED